MSLTTFWREDRAVATPVWFALDGGTDRCIHGARTGKATRIHGNDHVCSSILA